MNIQDIVCLGKYWNGILRGVLGFKFFTVL